MNTPETWKKLQMAHLAADGVLIASLGTTTRIVLVAVTCDVGMSLKETDTDGDVVCHVGAGMNRFPALITMQANTALFAEDIQGTEGNITAFYYSVSTDGE